MKTIGLMFVLVLGLGVSGGCFQFHEDYPDETCESDLDCFLSQGERCNAETKACEVPSTNATNATHATVPELFIEDGSAASLMTIDDSELESTDEPTDAEVRDVQ